MYPNVIVGNTGWYVQSIGKVNQWITEFWDEAGKNPADWVDQHKQKILDRLMNSPELHWVVSEAHGIRRHLPEILDKGHY